MTTGRGFVTTGRGFVPRVVGPTGFWVVLGGGVSPSSSTFKYSGGFETGPSVGGRYVGA